MSTHETMCGGEGCWRWWRVQDHAVCECPSQLDAMCALPLLLLFRLIIKHEFVKADTLPGYSTLD